MHPGTLRVHLLATIAITVSLAGCASDPPPPPEDDTFGADVQATDTTGVIRGIVIDPSIVPVANATVALSNGDETKSDKDGQFWFEELEPGSYFIEVRKLGFTTAQSSTSVVAGDDRPPIVKVMIEHDIMSRPYVQYLQFEGFLQCSIQAGAPSVGSVGGNVCSLLDLSGQPIDSPLIEYELDRQPDWIQTEMVWESTQPLGDDLRLLHSWDCETNGGLLCDHGINGASPLTIFSNSTQVQGAGYDETKPLIVRVFSSAAAGSGGTAGVTFDQRFTHFTSVFYGFTPEPGWTFVENGQHALPN